MVGQRHTHNFRIRPQQSNPYNGQSLSFQLLGKRDIDNKKNSSLLPPVGGVQAWHDDKVMNPVADVEQGKH